MGASRIIAVDSVPARLELVAQKYGAETIDYSKIDDVVGYIKNIVGPDGLDKAVDATGFRYTKTTAQTLQRAVGLTTDSSDRYAAQTYAIGAWLTFRCTASTKSFYAYGNLAGSP
jgi:threonine dehydrogenase-like Zn-dependent dehydrogenase